MRLSLRASIASSLAVLAVMLTACRPSARLQGLNAGVSEKTDGRIIVHFVPCSGELVHRVDLVRITAASPSESDPVLWDIESASGTHSLTRFTIGVVPLGFSQSTALVGLPSSDERLALNIYTNYGRPQITFTPGQLRVGQILSFSEPDQGYAYFSLADLEERSGQRCSLYVGTHY